MTLTKPCVTCGQSFDKPPSNSVRYWATRKYCSRKCTPSVNKAGVLCGAELTAERLRQVLRYEPTTGLFTWILPSSIRVKPGDTAGSPTKGYVSIGVDGREYRAHRLAWLYVNGTWPSTADLDHINEDKSDNRIANLREASRSENMANVTAWKNNTSGYKGVTYNRRNDRWVAQTKKDKRPIFIGSFRTAEEAHAAYVNKARELFGEFANAGS